MCQPYKRRFKGGISTNIQLSRSPDDGHVMGFEKLRRELVIAAHIEISGDDGHRKHKMMEKQVGVSSLSIQNHRSRMALSLSFQRHLQIY